MSRRIPALLKQVWVELEPIRRVHEGRRRRRGSSELTRGFRFRGGRAVACCGCRGRVAEGRPACQRATRVLRWAPVLRMTRRPSLRSESSYGPCGPAWTGAVNFSHGVDVAKNSPKGTEIENFTCKNTTSEPCSPLESAICPVKSSTYGFLADTNYSVACSSGVGWYRIVCLPDEAYFR